MSKPEHKFADLVVTIWRLKAKRKKLWRQILRGIKNTRPGGMRKNPVLKEHAEVLCRLGAAAQALIR